MAPPKITRSKIWQVFRRLPGHSKVKCDFCHEMFSVKQNTSSALRHLRRKHYAEYQELFGPDGDPKLVPGEDGDQTSSPPQHQQQQFWLRWNHQADILGSLGGLFDSESFVDVTLFAEGRTLKAHKLILSSCSPYFESLFHDLNAPNPVIFLRDIRYDIMSAILNFVYRGEVFIDYSYLPELVKTADALKIKGLADISWNNSQVPVNIVQVEQKSHFPGLVKGIKSEPTRIPSSQQYEFIEHEDEMEMVEEEMDESHVEEVGIPETEIETFEEETEDEPAICTPSIRLHPKHLQRRSPASGKISKVATISDPAIEGGEAMMIVGITPEGNLTTRHVAQYPGDEWHEGNHIVGEEESVEIRSETPDHTET